MMEDVTKYFRYERERRRGKPRGVQLPFWVSPEVAQRVKRIATREGVSRTGVLRAALLAFLDAYEEAEKIETAENAPCSLPPERKEVNYG